MGIFGDSGFFGKLFDFNADGKVDCFEQTIELAFLDAMINEDSVSDANLFDDDSTADADSDW